MAQRRDLENEKGGLYCSSTIMPHNALTCAAMKVSEGFNNSMSFIAVESMWWWTVM
jgi:hypothetical protein